MTRTAGKITIATACSGLLVFAAVFLLDIGRDNFQSVSAQAPSGTATTSLIVRNLPPVWVEEAFEQTPSATNTPINSGQDVVWEALATNNHPYWLIVCSENATPTRQNAPIGEEGDPTYAPSCAAGEQWAISAPTASGDVAIASTTTNDDIGNPFEESNEWFAWVCDADLSDPRCSNAVQGEERATAESNDGFSSPFVVNFRPILSDVSNDSPTLPGDDVEFTSISSATSSLRGNDQITLHICATNVFIGGECDTGETLAVSDPGIENVEAFYNVNTPTVRFTYQAFGFLVDEFGHEAADSFQSDFEVANATPTVVAASISLNNGDDIELDVALGTTTGFTLDFTVSSDNSCVAFDGGVNQGAGSEFEDVIVSVFRESVGTSTCDGTAGPFNENNCYTSALPEQWDFSCTKNVSTCNDQGLETTDMSISYECEFSLWYLADPTDGEDTTQVEFPNDEWFAAASVVDAAGATSTFTQGEDGVDVISFLAFDLGIGNIPYGTLEPDEDTFTLPATTTIIATGNTGVDQSLEGSSMCPDFDVNGVTDGTDCSGDPADTIFAENQRFGLSPTDLYEFATDLARASENDPVSLALNVFKPTQILTASEGDIYWGIGVPGDITLAGNYTGQNTFFGVISDATEWSP